LHIKQGWRARNTNMKLAFVREGEGFLDVTVSTVGEHDVDDDEGFWLAVAEGCVAAGWNSDDWDFCLPASHMDMQWGCKVILCRPKGGTPVLPEFMNPV
jgi:hypothetical protein